jgi:hypothetical protein
MRRLEAGCTIVALALAVGCSDESVTGREGDVDLRATAEESPDLHRAGHSHGRAIAILDACDPRDPGWAPTGGCLLRRGDVSFAEFGAFLSSPHSLSVVGHPAWRNDPSYLSVGSGKDIRVTNDGGRLHTFTEVAQFGGGRVPPLNMGLTPAPECLLAPGAADPTAVEPGGRMRLDDLPAGIHRFQCCIHPWMRAAIRVSEADHGRR